MHANNDAAPIDGHDAEGRGATVIVWLVAAVAVAILALAWNAASYRLHGTPSPIFLVFSVFLSLNLLICYWEICLYLKRDHIAERARYWRERGTSTGRTPAVEFLTARVPLRRIASASVWADTWAAYSLYDSAYTDRRSFGFNADVGNGFVTPIPSIVLLAALTFGIMPAMFAGILGVALFWQWVYVSSLYAVSVWISGEHEALPRTVRWLYVWGPNSVWIIVPLLGLFVSVRLIVDGNYAVIGH